MTRFALTLLLFVACRSGEPPAPSSTIELRDAGKAPHRALGYAPVAQTRAPLLVWHDKEPTLTFTLGWKQTAGLPDVRYRFSIDDAEFAQHRDPEIESMMKDMPAGTLRGDAQGRVTAAVPGARWTTPSVPPTLVAIVVPFPAEPIGIGARWHVETTVSEATQRNTYELTELRGDGATVTWRGDIAQSGGSWRRSRRRCACGSTICCRSAAR